MNELSHHYGSQVHLIENPYLAGQLAQLCSPDTLQPQINSLVETLYENLLAHVIAQEFPKETFSQPTRMNQYHREAVIHGERVSRQQRAICVNIARAGTLPSHICYNQLHQVIDPAQIRQDHIFAARTTTARDEVSGTEIGASKIGGDKENAIILIPDPMGATGSTILAAMNHYRKNVPGRALKVIAIHLIVTPEYLRKVLDAESEISIYALRLDRGLSPEAVLKTPLGSNWAQERGLNEKGYIVPGGGGFGEIMNNSFV